MSRNSDCSSYDFTMNYDLKTKIGEGTFSDVWLCVKRDNGKRMAAKILKMNYRSSEVNAATLDAMSEVKIARTVGNHPFLLMMAGAYFNIECGKIVLVSELMKKSLYEVIKKSGNSLSPFRIKFYTYQMLEGLKYLHRNDIIHRDIKPENVLLRSRDKQLKIGDFGTSCHVSEGQPHDVEYVATRWYRSPECILTRGWYGKKMDVWSVGCVLYEMVVGHAMFRGADEVDQMQRIECVLGRPSTRLMYRFKRNRSEVFTRLYGTGDGWKRWADPGCGLRMMYHPHMPAYDVLKGMIVYDPAKRFSAERLLRKSYFDEVHGTSYHQKVKEFEESHGHNGAAANGLPNRENNGARCQVNQVQPSINDQQGPNGDRPLHFHADTVEKAKKPRKKDSCKECLKKIICSIIMPKTRNVTVHNQDNSSSLSPVINIKIGHLLEKQSKIDSKSEKTSTIKIRRNLLGRLLFK